MASDAGDDDDRMNRTRTRNGVASVLKIIKFLISDRLYTYLLIVR
jgi:hypothetical protein